MWGGKAVEMTAENLLKVIDTPNFKRNENFEDLNESVATFTWQSCKELEIENSYELVIEKISDFKILSQKVYDHRFHKHEMLDKDTQTWREAYVMEEVVVKDQEQYELRSCRNCKFSFVEKKNPRGKFSTRIMLWNIRSASKDLDVRTVKLTKMQQIIKENDPEVVYINEFRHEDERLKDAFKDYLMLKDGDIRNFSFLFYKKQYEGFFGTDRIESEGEQLHFFTYVGMEKLAFTYIRPLNNPVHTRMALELLDRGYHLLGDLNLKTNIGLAKEIKTRKFRVMEGDNKRITVVDIDRYSTKFDLLKVIKCDRMKHITDHNCLIISTNIEKLKNNLVYIHNKKLLKNKQLRWMEKIVNENTMVPFIVKEEEKFKPLVINSELIESRTRLMSALTLLFNKNQREFWNKMNKLSAKSFDMRGKELYNGELTDEVIKGFKELYWHKDDKAYYKEYLVRLLEETMKEDWGLIYSWRRSKTKALDFNGLSVGQMWVFAREKVENVMREIGTWYQEDDWEETIEGVKKRTIINDAIMSITEKMKSLIVDSVSRNLIDNVTRTFFLKKNQTVVSYKDLRTIAIAPSTCIFYENMIAKECTMEIRKILKEEWGEQYQFGGVNECSTIDAIYYMFSGKRTAEDVEILIDLSSAYESTILELLCMEIIQEPKFSQKVRVALVALVFWMRETDIDFAGIRINRTKSLGMGNVMSPVLFSFYMHKALMKLDRQFIKKLGAFVDDIIVRTTAGHMTPVVTDFVKVFKERNLTLNVRKTEVIATPIVIAMRIKEIKDLGINVAKKTKYLGAQLEIVGSKVTFDQKKLGIYLMDNKVKLNNAPLKVKMAYLQSSIIGKWRYGMYTLILEKSSEKVMNKIRKKIAKVTGYQRLSYGDCILLNISPIEMNIRMVYSVLMNVGTDYETLVNKIIEKIRDIVDNSPSLNEAFTDELDRIKSRAFGYVEVMGKRKNDLAEKIQAKALYEGILWEVNKHILGESKQMLLGNKFVAYDTLYLILTRGDYIFEGMPLDKMKDMKNIKFMAYVLILSFWDYIMNERSDEFKWSLRQNGVRFWNIDMEINGEDLLKTVVLVDGRVKQNKNMWKLSQRSTELTAARRAYKTVKKQLMKLDMMLLRTKNEPGYKPSLAEMENIDRLEGLENYYVSATY